MLRFLSILLLTCLSFATFSFAASKAERPKRSSGSGFETISGRGAEGRRIECGLRSSLRGRPARLGTCPTSRRPAFPKPSSAKQSQAEFSSPGSYFSEKRLQGLAADGPQPRLRHARL